MPTQPETVSAPTQVLPHDEASPNLELMPRADLPAIWGSFREQALRLKGLVETLTVTDAAQTSEMAIARATRLELRKLRSTIEHKRVELKEDALRRGKQIDAAANELKALIEPLETRLLEQETFLAREEAKRKVALFAERAEKLLPFNVTPSAFNLAEMSELDFEQLLANSRTAHEAKLEAARKAEEERAAREQAEAAERERIRQENIRLKAEAEERERVAKIEREEVERERREAAAAAECERLRVEAEKRAAAEQARREREAVEAKAAEDQRIAAEKAAAELAAQRVEAERIQAERDVKDAAERFHLSALAKAEREAREKLEREAKAKRDKEERERKAAEKAARDAAKAPDKIKLAGFAGVVRGLSVPTLTTLEGNGVAKEVEKAIRDLATWIDGKAASL